jgi:hypothetical protein
MVRQQIGTKKLMLTVIEGVAGWHVVDLMTSERCFNSEHFMSIVMAPMITKAFPHGRNLHTRRLHLHLDDCCIHFLKVTGRIIIENHILYVTQPLYSPILHSQTSGLSVMRRLR